MFGRKGEALVKKTLCENSNKMFSAAMSDDCLVRPIHKMTSNPHE